MSLRTTILASACAAALGGLVASPAMATDFDGLLGADYSHLTLNHHGGKANIWGVSGTGTVGLVPAVAVQIDGGYHNADFDHGASSDDWDINGTPFWRSNFGRVGAVVGYHSISGDGADSHATNYGGFGEWYAAKWFTLGLKGGGFNGSDHNSGGYAGGLAKAYIGHNFAFDIGYDYTHVDHVGNESDWSAKGEWLISEHIPVSIWAGFTNSKFDHDGPTANTYSAGLTYYFDQVDAAPLVQRQRAGSEQWGNAFGPVALRY